LSIGVEAQDHALWIKLLYQVVGKSRYLGKIKSSSVRIYYRIAKNLEGQHKGEIPANIHMA
jgi:hypothetical protein